MPTLLKNAAVRFADKEILQRLNAEAIQRKYNRTLVADAINELADDELFAISPILIHEHAQGKAVEPHLRCSVQARGQDIGFVVLDVPVELFEFLPDQQMLTANKPKTKKGKNG